MLLEAIGINVISSYLYDVAKRHLPERLWTMSDGLSSSNYGLLVEADQIADGVIRRTRSKYAHLRTVQKFLDTETGLREGVLFPLFDYFFADGPIPRQALIDSLLDFREGGELAPERMIKNVPAGEVVDYIIDELKKEFGRSSNLISPLLKLSINQIKEKVSSIQKLAESLQTQLHDLTSLPDHDLRMFCRDLLQLQKARVEQLSISGAQKWGLKSSVKHVLQGSFVDLKLTALSSEGLLEQVKSTTAKHVAAVSALEAISSLPRVIIRGPAGCGKTTMLHWLIHQSHAPDLTAPMGSTSRGALFPIFIPLRRLEQGMLEDWHIRSVFRFTLASHDLESRIPSNFFEVLSSHKIDIAFLLDGLDEVSEENRDGVWKTVETIERDYPAARIIISSRNLATIHLSDGRVKESIYSNSDEYRNAQSQWRPSAAFFEFVVAPLSNDQISHFIDRWFDGISPSYLLPAEVDDIRRYPAKLRVELFAENNFDTLELSRTPLLCALICLVFYLREGTLPRSRRELYEIATEILVESRDEMRRVRVPRRLVTFGREDRLSVLRYIALEMQEGSEQSTGQAIEAAKESVLSMVENWISRSEAAYKGAAELLEFLIERCSIIREPAFGRVDFIHRSFMEYLAAQELVGTRTTYALRLKIELEQWRSTLQFCMNTPQGGFFYAGQLVSEFVSYVKENSHGPRAKPKEWRRKIYRRVASLLSPSDEFPYQFSDSIRELAKQVLPPTNLDEMRDCIGIPFIYLRDRLDYSEVVKHGNDSVILSAVLLARHEDERCASILASGYENVPDPGVIQEINRSGRVDASRHTALLARLRNKSFENKKVYLYADSLQSKELRCLITRYVGLRFPLDADRFVGWDILPRCFDVTIQYACSGDWRSMIESVNKRRFDSCLSLELYGCTDFSFQMLAALFPQIRMLVIEDCRHFSVDGLERNERLDMLEFRRIAQPIIISDAGISIALSSISFLSCGATCLPESLGRKGIAIVQGVSR